MGFILKIGELETLIEEGEIINYARFEKNNDAPAFGEYNDYTNIREPSYTAWEESMSFIGLKKMMYDTENGLIRNHPGCVPLTKEHKEIIDKTYKEFYEKYPNCKAGYSPKMDEAKGIYDNKWPKENSYAVRLEWLKYWIDWALENCKNPVFYNS
jgi:hypothetical protein